MNEYLEACQATPMEDDLTGTDLIEAIHKENKRNLPVRACSISI